MPMALRFNKGPCISINTNSTGLAYNCSSVWPRRVTLPTLTHGAVLRACLQHTDSLCAVRRVQDSLGYFWWELYQDLKEYKTVGTCEYCESIFRGGTSRPAGQGSIRHHSSPRIPPSALAFACLLFYRSLLGD